MTSLKNPSSNFETILAGGRARVDADVERWLGRLGWVEYLPEGARYLVSGGGKAARPALVAWAWSQFAASPGALAPEPVRDLGLALEFIHCYSLAHDDLPCMDDDDFRRGRPTAHRLYGEAGAVLLGDALLTGAFEIVSQICALPADARVLATRELARAAGAAGMVGGQVIDITLKGTVTLDALVRNHNLKTGALFGAALALGSIGHDAARLDRHDQARAWGVKLGLLFQVVDDLLDAGEEGPSFVALQGLDGARATARRLSAELAAEGSALDFDTEALASLLGYFVGRSI